MARAANSTAAKPENILLALRDISTNITIPNFPATAGDLQSITGTYYSYHATITVCLSNFSLQDEKLRGF